MSKRQKVLVVGGGFGGVKAALELADDERFAVTILSDSADLRYYPTLYHTATGGRRANSSIPLANIFMDKPVNLVTDTAVELDRAGRQIVTRAGDVYEYDSLILALGVVTNYFGIKGLDKYSYSIKSQSSVERFKKHLHKQLEDEKRPDLNYVIVGAGPTGTELAGALPGYLHEIMRHHGLPKRKVHVDLIEAAPRLLPRLPKTTSRAVRRRLKKLRVRLHLGKTVSGQTADTLLVGRKPIRSHTVVWTAGVTNHPFFSANEFVSMRHGKVAVDTYLKAEDNIFVIGDNANTPYSGSAQTALYDGAFVAKNLRRQASGKDFRSYKARKPISVIPVGPGWAAVSWGRLRLSGRLGWFIRSAADLIGFHDLEPWDRAIKQWLTEFSNQDDCAVCDKARRK